MAGYGGEVCDSGSLIQTDALGQTDKGAYKGRVRAEDFRATLSELRKLLPEERMVTDSKLTR